MVQPEPVPADLTPDPSDSAADILRHSAMRVAALAQNGLAFSANPFDIDRFEQLRDVAANLLAVLSDQPTADWTMELGREVGYVTPKVEVRGALIDDRQRFLLMREALDGRWSLPGGFADPLDTPAQAVVREVREETGYGAEAIKLVGCWDRDQRGHRPRLAVSIYKLFFLCRATGDQQPPAELETLDVGWFGLDELPELSPGRVNRWEIDRMLAHHLDPSLPTEFD